jgi:hypothetical protein
MTTEVALGTTAGVAVIPKRSPCHPETFPPVIPKRSPLPCHPEERSDEGSRRVCHRLPLHSQMQIPRWRSE